MWPHYSTNQINKSSTWAVFHRILWMRFHSGTANSHQPEPVFFFFNSHTGTITWRTFYPVKTTKWNKADGLPCITWLFWLGSIFKQNIFFWCFPDHQSANKLNCFISGVSENCFRCRISINNWSCFTDKKILINIPINNKIHVWLNENLFYDRSKI